MWPDHTGSIECVDRHRVGPCAGPHADLRAQGGYGRLPWCRLGVLCAVYSHTSTLGREGRGNTQIVAAVAGDILTVAGDFATVAVWQLWRVTLLLLRGCSDCCGRRNDCCGRVVFLLVLVVL